MTGLFQALFFSLIVKPLVLVVLGFNIHHRERLPLKGPAIIVANHNSHLDSLVLMSLFSASQRWKLRPMAAADYFLKNRLLAWFSKTIFHIVPIERSGTSLMENFLQKGLAVLDAGEIVLLYPEGTRGEPEKLSKFKSGIAALAQARDTVPVIPIFMHGLGKSLPRGEGILVPFFCDVVIGEPINWTGNKENYLELLSQKMQELASEVEIRSWD